MTEPPPRKRFGQHFLHDRNIIDKIIAAVEPETDQHFVEIGPGRGALTRPLLARVAQLDVIEIDRDLASRLEYELHDPRVTVHRANALKFDLGTLDIRLGELRVVGNLPYNISSPLLFHLLGQARWLSDLHVMLQKEVVDRMTAEPGNRTYGRLTVALTARCRVQRLFDIKPGSFMPPPKVASSFVRVVPETERLARLHDEKAFDSLVTRAFSMRRKRIANALRGLVSEEQMASLQIDPDARAERLSVDDYIRLANLQPKQSVR